MALICSSMAAQRKIATDIAASKSTALDDEGPPSKRKKRSFGSLDSTDSAPDCDAPSAAAGVTPAPKSCERAPKVFYGTRTHAQVAQVVGELRKTSYRPHLAVLASRDLYCINGAVKSRKDRDAECRRMLAEQRCRFAEGADRLAGHKELRGRAWDVEDLVSLGRKVAGCPYLASKTISQSAELVVCPYNYVIDWKVREALGISLKGAVVVVDEAHNIGDSLMEAASCEVDLVAVQEEVVPKLREIAKDAPALAPQAEALAGVAGALARWASEKAGSLQPTDFERRTNVWRGEEAVKILSDAGLSKETLPNLWRAFAELTNIGKEGHDDDEGGGGGDEASAGGRKKGKKGALPPTLGAKVTSILDSLLAATKFMLSCKMKFVPDYRLVIEKSRKREFGGEAAAAAAAAAAGGEFGWTLGLWCMSPAAAFAPITKKARSVILASGTLAPLDPLAMDLRAEFPVRAELGHVVDACQVFACVVGEFEVTFRRAEELSVQDAVGRSLLACCGAIPAGVLCFFPSYSLLSKMSQRWRTTGAMATIAASKGGNVFSEESGHQSNRSGKASTTKREDFTKMLGDFRAASRTAKGALMLAVCRGKASEGLDFSDEAARGVVVVGVPYPNTRDLRVILKKEHEEATSRGAGNSWYVSQGHRAANQAIGRVVRHRWDYGAVVLLDSRYSRPDVSGQLCRWVRTSLVRVPTMEEATSKLAQFFETAQKHVSDHKTGAPPAVPIHAAPPAAAAAASPPIAQISTDSIPKSTSPNEETPSAQILTRKRSI